MLESKILICNFFTVLVIVQWEFPWARGTNIYIYIYTTGTPPTRLGHPKMRLS
jgi:hypothetical protein